jgi:hypothetical protein
VAAGTPALIDLPFHQNLYLIRLGGCVVVAGSLLIYHYNRRMTDARNQILTVVAWMKEHGLDYTAITDVDLSKAYASGEDYDFREFLWFLIILVSSWLAILPSLFFLQR